FGTKDKECPDQPKKFEDEEVEALLDQDQSQTQEELAESLNVDRLTISRRLKAIGMHPPYSPDIAPSDYYLFRSMTHGLSEQRFHSYKDTKKWVDSWIKRCVVLSMWNPPYQKDRKKWLAMDNILNVTIFLQ
ncbi:MOS1T transposase, partial [Pseudoatta argentina]